MITLPNAHEAENTSIVSLCNDDILFRQSFADSLVASIKAYTGTNYTDEDINFALYSHYISGWGMGNATHQVNISTQPHIIDKIA